MTDAMVEQSMRVAVEHHRAGRAAEAGQIYRQVLSRKPDHPAALHMLGMVAYYEGRHDEAEKLVRQAIALNPTLAEAHGNLGLILKNQGKLADAIASFRKSLELNPDIPEVHNNLGNALDAMGKLDEAVQAFGRATELRPEYFVAHSNLGSTLQTQKKYDEAIAAFRAAITLKPDQFQLYMNLGNALKDLRRFGDAIAAYQRAINLKPDFAEAYLSMGTAFDEQNKLAEAADCYRDAIKHQPNLVEAHYNLGNALRDQCRLDEAIAAYDQAIACPRQLTDAYVNKGNILKDQGRLDDAIATYRQAITVEPGKQLAISNVLYVLHFHPDYDARAIAQAHRDWADRFARPLEKFWQPHGNTPEPNRRLRIGYVSPDFRAHVVGRNLLPLYLQHDHEQFEITTYAEVRHPDAMTAKFKEKSDRWRDISDLTDEQLAAQIGDDRIDILVDLTLHMAKNRLLVFARKPAPVQATFAGYPGSTGLAAIDYRLSDPYLDPPGTDESIYAEKTLRLPDTFWCYDPQATAQVNPLPALTAGVITFGCLGNFCKTNNQVFKLWAQVLREVDRSRLLLLSAPGNHRMRAVERFSAEGIDSKRIGFVPHQTRQDYLDVYHHIDIGLDTFPYNGHTTSLDSLWMGVPVVTLVGSRIVSRAGWSQLSNLGLTELAGDSPEQFVNIAAGLAKDLPRLRDLRSTLRRRVESSPLMDARRFTRGIESAYRQMWREYCRAQTSQ
jgi:predicted O-linked N-acetylglucosamine transferase (SPINDLY family)